MYNSYLFKHDYCQGSSEKGQMKVNFSQTWQNGRILNYFFFFFNFTRLIPLQHCIGQNRKPTVILNLLELCEMGLSTFHTD